MTTQLLDSEIRYSKTTRDYDILICGSIVASAPNYSAAELIRSQILSDRIQDGCYATATELDADSDPFGDPRTDEEKQWDAEGWAECEGGWEKFGPHPFDSSKTVRHFRPRLFTAAVPDGTDPNDFSDTEPTDPPRADSAVRTHLTFGHLRRDLFAAVLFCACGERASIVRYGTPDVYVCDDCHAAPMALVNWNS